MPDHVEREGMIWAQILCIRLKGAYKCNLKCKKTAKNICRDIKLVTLKMDRSPINWIQKHNSMDPRLKEYAYDVLWQNPHITPLNRANPKIDMKVGSVENNRGNIMYNILERKKLSFWGPLYAHAIACVKHCVTTSGAPEANHWIQRSIGWNVWNWTSE
jgi:hypothetical protein